MPKLKVMESDALNAFDTGMNPRQYSITVTSGLLGLLDDAEIESVLGHELTHIRNGDVRMMVVAVVIAGVVSSFAELFFRMWFYGGFRGFRGSRSSGDRRGGGAGFAILIAIGLVVLAYLLSFIIRLALSRSREFLADAGSMELTKNPDAMIMALRKIEGRGELPGATSAVMETRKPNPNCRRPPAHGNHRRRARTLGLAGRTQRRRSFERRAAGEHRHLLAARTMGTAQRPLALKYSRPHPPAAELRFRYGEPPRIAIERARLQLQPQWRHNPETHTAKQTRYVGLPNSTADV
jgi:Zn-dependent protease with chaperone function